MRFDLGKTAVVALLAAAIACSSPTESAVNRLVEEVRLGDPLASSTYEDNKEALESEEALPLWIDTLRNDEDPGVKQWAARILGNIGDPEAVPALTEALGDHREVRDAATDALMQIGEEEAAAAFAEGLDNESRDAVVHCLVQLSRLESTEHVGAIVETAQSSDPLVAETAINTLGDIGASGAVEDLASIAVDDSRETSVRRTAIVNIGRIGGEGAQQQLDSIVETLQEQEGSEDLVEVAREATGQ